MKKGFKSSNTLPARRDELSQAVPDGSFHGGPDDAWGRRTQPTLGIGGRLLIGSAEHTFLELKCRGKSVCDVSEIKS
jgi:hypothetical protein